MMEDKIKAEFKARLELLADSITDYAASPKDEAIHDMMEWFFTDMQWLIIHKDEPITRQVDCPECERVTGARMIGKDEFERPIYEDIPVKYERCVLKDNKDCCPENDVRQVECPKVNYEPDQDEFEGCMYCECWQKCPTCTDGKVTETVVRVERTYFKYARIDGSRYEDKVTPVTVATFDPSSVMEWRRV